MQLTLWHIVQPSSSKYRTMRVPRFKEKLEISNEIFFYAPQPQETELEEVKAKAKEKVLESFGVQYQSVSYEFVKNSANPKYLLSVYKMISQQRK